MKKRQCDDQRFRTSEMNNQLNKTFNSGLLRRAIYRKWNILEILAVDIFVKRSPCGVTYAIDKHRPCSKNRFLAGPLYGEPQSSRNATLIKGAD